MAKSQLPPASENSSWLAFALIGLCGILIGATGTYLLLLPRLQRASIPPDATVLSDPRSHRPPGDLTAGMPPAQADRTLGNFYYDHENWSQAIHHYELAVRQGADDADTRTDLGNAYRFSGRPGDALAQYRLAQQMNPAHEFSLFNQGGLFFEDLHQPQKAVEIWQEYLARFPQGRNAEAARQLIAKTTASMPPSTPSQSGAPASQPATSAAESAPIVLPALTLPAKSPFSELPVANKPPPAPPVTPADGKP
jgi:tetratricopeptide (TPR) repeat protein